jgi:hypothetical protein
MVGPETDEQLARHPVAGAVFLGPVFAHVTPTDASSPLPDLHQLLNDYQDAFHYHEAERWAIIVHTDGGPAVPGQIATLDRVLARVEDQGAVVVDDIPDGSHVRTTVGPHCGQLPGTRRRCGEEGADLSCTHLVIWHRRQPGLPPLALKAADHAPTTGPKLAGL